MSSTRSASLSSAAQMSLSGLPSRHGTTVIADRFETLALGLGIEVANAEHDDVLLDEWCAVADLCPVVAIAVASHDRERHSGEEAARRCRGRVEVCMGVDPHDAGACMVEAAEDALAGHARASKHERQAASVDRSTDERRYFSINCRRRARRVAERAWALGDLDCDVVTLPFQQLARTRLDQTARASARPVAVIASVGWNRDQRDLDKHSSGSPSSTRVAQPTYRRPEERRVASPRPPVASKRSVTTRHIYANRVRRRRL